MQEISIVKRRSRVWPVLLVLILLAILALAAFWFMGDAAPPAVGLNHLIDATAGAAAPRTSA